MAETARRRLAAQKRTRQSRPGAALRDMLLDHNQVSALFKIGMKAVGISA